MEVDGKLNQEESYVYAEELFYNADKVSDPFTSSPHSLVLLGTFPSKRMLILSFTGVDMLFFVSATNFDVALCCAVL